ALLLSSGRAAEAVAASERLLKDWPAEQSVESIHGEALLAAGQTSRLLAWIAAMTAATAAPGGRSAARSGAGPVRNPAGSIPSDEAGTGGTQPPPRWALQLKAKALEAEGKTDEAIRARLEAAEAGGDGGANRLGAAVLLRRAGRLEESTGEA